MGPVSKGVVAVLALALVWLVVRRLRERRLDEADAATDADSGGDDGPMDQVALKFGRLKAEYRAQKPDGSLDAPVTAGWDLKAGKQV